MHTTDINSVSNKILQELLQYRRILPEGGRDSSETRAIAKVQLPRIKFFVERGERIEFILPAFPGKSPNLNKVLGVIPDMAERLSLTFLNEFCQKIQLHYKPGARITICSDGHVFADLIYVSDETINEYQKEMKSILHELGATNLSVFNLEDVTEMSALSQDYNALRESLLDKYTVSQHEIKKSLIESEHGLQLYRAITRFLYEDSLVPGYTGSKAQLQKNAKQRACGVVQRSWAWGNLLEKIFPEAIRLSIHPQPADSIKIGIHMMPTKDDWLTPWHGVAAKVNGSFVLMKRKEAQQLSGELIKVSGNPSYYLVSE